MAIDKNNLDTAVSPGDNFYHYANGGWLAKHPIPDEFSRYGTFDILREDNRKIVRSIIEEVAGSGSAEGSGEHVARLVGDFYRTGMDTDAIDEKGFLPIVKELESISSISNKQDIRSFFKLLQPQNLLCYFEIVDKNSY